MANAQESMGYIIQAIENIVDANAEKLEYDKTYRARVTEIISSNRYKVEIKDVEYELSYEGGTLNIGDIVNVKAPLNNFSDIYIEAVPTSGGGSEGTYNYNELSNKPTLDTTSTTALTPTTETIQRNSKFT